ncbi:hypothetical protein [Mycoplasma sp. 1654_15]|uniref:hypothetical protein n=1 Tax=Mycoplasma sp. 1654_15 TaxID=2725994 RepID=UPI0014495DE3|nr:hypothetical protein [Mycoplasma sp. 1654_15]QJB71142.1 hypothetical protein HF996_01380 [Mycoplasma sp. 1654_15]
MFIQLVTTGIEPTKTDSSSNFSAEFQAQLAIQNIFVIPIILVPNICLLHLFLWIISQFKRNSYLYKFFIYHYKDYSYLLVWLFFFVVIFIFNFAFFSLLIAFSKIRSFIPVNFVYMFVTPFLISLFFSPLPLIYFVIKAKKYWLFLLIFYILFCGLFLIGIALKIFLQIQQLFGDRYSKSTDTFLNVLTYLVPTNFLVRPVELLFKDTQQNSYFNFFSQQWFNYVDVIVYPIVLVSLNVCVLSTNLIKGAKWVKFN